MSRFRFVSNPQGVPLVRENREGQSSHRHEGTSSRQLTTSPGRCSFSSVDSSSSAVGDGRSQRRHTYQAGGLEATAAAATMGTSKSMTTFTSRRRTVRRMSKSGGLLSKSKKGSSRDLLSVATLESLSEVSSTDFSSSTEAFDSQSQYHELRSSSMPSVIETMPASTTTTAMTTRRREPVPVHSNAMRHESTASFDHAISNMTAVHMQAMICLLTLNRSINSLFDGITAILEHCSGLMLSILFDEKTMERFIVKGLPSYLSEGDEHPTKERRMQTSCSPSFAAADANTPMPRLVLNAESSMSGGSWGHFADFEEEHMKSLSSLQSLLDHGKGLQTLKEVDESPATGDDINQHHPNSNNNITNVHNFHDDTSEDSSEDDDNFF